jgi:virginiamycin B lyase
MARMYVLCLIWLLAICVPPANAQPLDQPDLVSTFAIPTEQCCADHLAAGTDGALWFISERINEIGRMTIDGEFTSFPLGSGEPMGIGTLVSGPDGALWFTAYFANQIGRLTTEGALTLYPVPSEGRQPGKLTAGSDHALWFTLQDPSLFLSPSHWRIGRITTEGEFSEFLVPRAERDSPLFLYSLAVGPDGALWFTTGFGRQIGRLTPTGALTTYLVPPDTRFQARNVYPWRIVAGPDGALWFSENGTGTLWRVTTEGAFTGPMEVGGNRIDDMIWGPDGALWCSVVRWQFGGPRSNISGSTLEIARVAVDGTVTRYPVEGRTLAVGPDQAIWYVTPDGRRIGWIPTDASPGTATTLTTLE